jgi:hypothetical protein
MTTRTGKDGDAETNVVDEAPRYRQLRAAGSLLLFVLWGALRALWVRTASAFSLKGVVVNLVAVTAIFHRVVLAWGFA